MKTEVIQTEILLHTPVHSESNDGHKEYLKHKTDETVGFYDTVSCCTQIYTIIYNGDHSMYSYDVI